MLPLCPSLHSTGGPAWPVAALSHRASPVLGLLLLTLALSAAAAPFDAAPFALPLPEGNGLLWEDPREVHQVVVHFAGTAPPPEQVQIEYWGSRWPQQHLPNYRLSTWNLVDGNWPAWQALHPWLPEDQTP